MTFGYAGLKDADELADLLSPDVAVVVDVRLNAWSGNHALSGWTRQAVEDAGYEYLHLPALGNAEHRSGGMRIADIEAIGTVLEIIATGRTVALMCVCSDVATCHRLVLAEEAKRWVPGLTVSHRGQPSPPDQQKAVRLADLSPPQLRVVEALLAGQSAADRQPGKSG